MNWFKESRSLYIARPQQFAKSLIYLHPDTTIPRGAHLTVRSDEQALFYREGQCVGTLAPGTYQLDTANIPFLGHLVVNAVSGGNHFITELFFVGTSECIVDLPATKLGGYQDQNSKNLVTLIGSASYTLKVSDGRKLISEVGGQSQYSEDVVLNIVNGRTISLIRQIVGRRAAQAPIVAIISNADAEGIGTEMAIQSKTEFASMGLEIVRVMNLQVQLDELSLKLLQDFGRQEAGLAIQSKGAKVASEDGFADFNLVQGQRAALEGLGKGLGSGNGGMFIGMGLGGDLTRVNRSTVQKPSVSSPSATGPILPGQKLIYVISEKGETGPYSPRQVALLALSSNRGLAEMRIRADGDPAECVIPADTDPLVVAEYSRRSPKK